MLPYKLIFCPLNICEGSDPGNSDGDAAKVIRRITGWGLNDRITLQVLFVFPVWTQVLMGLQVTPEVGPPGRLRTRVKSLEGSPL